MGRPITSTDAPASRAARRPHHPLLVADIRARGRMPGTTSRKSGPKLGAQARDLVRRTHHAIQAALLRQAASRSTWSPTGGVRPTRGQVFIRQAGQHGDGDHPGRRRDALAASTAARIIAAPPWAWTLRMETPSCAAARHAPATVLGMSWIFQVQEDRQAHSAKARTPSGPCAVKNSSPSFKPPTWPRTRSASCAGIVEIGGI